jgi:activating signal cointegrator 1
LRAQIAGITTEQTGPIFTIESARSAKAAQQDWTSFRKVPMPKSKPSGPKALSIAQPWAELILRHRKPIEIRSWTRTYRGQLLIHASGTWRASDARQLGINKSEVTFGAFVGVATLQEIRPFTKADAKLLKKKRGGYDWWEPGQYAWVLTGVKRIEPIPFKGQLGLYSPPEEVIREVNRRAKVKRTTALAKVAVGAR